MSSTYRVYGPLCHAWPIRIVEFCHGDGSVRTLQQLVECDVSGVGIASLGSEHQTSPSRPVAVGGKYILGEDKLSLPNVWSMDPPACALIGKTACS